MTDSLLMIIARAVGVGGVVLLCVALPLFASFLLDGIANLVRHKGPRLLIWAAAASLGVVALGVGAWQWGSNNDMAGIDTSESDSAVALFFLMIVVPIALGAAVIRVFRSSKKRSDA